MKNNIFRRILSIILVILVVVNLLPTNVLAKEKDNNNSGNFNNYIANDIEEHGFKRDEEAARKVAEDFLSEIEVNFRSGFFSFNSDELELSYPIEETSFRSGLNLEEDSELYAFNKKSGGFIIVAGDKRATDILGYSTEGKFDLDSAPEELKSWIAEYENQIKYIRQNPKEFEDVVKQKSILHDEASSSQSSVAPFMNDIKWDQMEPYNRLAPDYVSGRKSAIGCVATAMAQVMKYYEYPQQGVKDASYEWTNSYNYNEKKTLTAEISKHTYNWDKMPKSYNGTEDEESKNEVAKLMYDAAVSAKMDFGPSSGTASLFAGQALVDNFGYDRGLKNLYRLAYNSNEWHNIVKEELMAKRPVFYGGTGAGGGHQFILDGFNDQNLYHVNWGWSGAGNGYYALDAMNPTFQGTGAGGGSYNMNQEILTGIKPADENITENRIRGNNTGKIFSYGTNNQIADLNKKEYRTTKSEIILSQWDITVEGMDGFNGEFGLGIDVNGTIRFSQNNKNFGTGHYLPNLPIAWQNLQIVDPIPDGEYEIKLYKKATGENEYTEIPNKQGQSDIIKVKVEGESVTYYLNELDKVNLEQISFAKSGDELYSGRTGKFTANIKNNGNNEYNSLMYIKLTDKSSGKTFNIGKRQIEIVAGGEREFDLEEELKYNNNNIPAGNYTATLMYNKGNTQEDISMDLYVPLGNSIDVEIKEFVEGKLAFVQNLEFVEKTEPKIVNDKNDLKISTKVKSTGGLYDVKFTAMVVDKLVSGTVNPIIQFTSTPVIVKDGETKEIFLECHEDISNLINEKDYYIIFVMNEGEWVTDHNGFGNPYFITFKYIKQEVDKSELQTKYNEVKNLEQGDYTDESWNALNTARETAKKVLANETATQEEVNNAKTALETAITNLAETAKVFNVTVKVEPSNATIKVTKKGEAEEIVGTDGVYKLEAGEYTVTGTAEGYKDGSKDFTVDTENMTVELNLTKIVNKTELENAITEAEKLKEAEYTPETWGPFAEALETAKDVLANETATQEEVNNAKTALETAITNLAETAKVFDVTVKVEPSNATIKVTKKGEAEEIVGTDGVYKLEAGEYTVTGTAEGYKEESKDFIVDTENMTVELNLTKIVNKTELENAITEAEKLKEAEYTPETWGPFAEALETAKDVLANETATQEEVNNAKTALETAITNLAETAKVFDVTVKVEPSNATIKVTKKGEAEEIVGTDGVYKLEAGEYTVTGTAEGYKDGSKDFTVDTENITVELNLTKIVNKTELENAITEAEKLKEAEYTPETWGPFAEALETAKDVLANETATQEEVNNAKTALETAITNLAETAKVFDVTVKVEPSNATIKVTKKGEAEEIVGTDGVYKLEAGEYTVTGTAEGYKEESKDFIVDTENMTVELNLTKIVNKTELENAITEAEKLKEAEYTPETWGPFAEALETAKDVLANETATQEEVNNAKTALETAITNLAETAKVFDVTVKVEPSNATIKVTKKGEAEEIVGTDGVYKLEAGEYTVTGTAEGYKDGSKDFTVDTENITVELNLTKIVNKTELENAITEAEKLKEAEYTPETWGPFAEALETAKDVLANETATQEEVNNAKTALETAITNLAETAKVFDVTVKVEPSNATIKVTKKGEAEEIVGTDGVYKLEAGEYTVTGTAEGYKEESKDFIVDTENMTVELNLTKIVNKTELENAITEAEKLKEAEYTPETWGPFAEALETAKDVLANETATQEEVNNAKTALETAITNLAETAKVFDVTVKVEPSNATIKVTKKGEAEEIVGTDGVYKLEAGEYTVTGTSEGYKDGSKDFTVDTENITVELTLTKIVNKTELENAITEAEKLKEAEYTPETWGPFAEALETAKDVLANETATQEEVNNAKTALETAITNLAETAKVFDVTVKVEPSNATIKVTKKGETEEIVGTEGVYKLEAGEYTVTGTSEGYKDGSKDFIVGTENITVELSLTKIVNKKALQDKYNEVKDLEKGDYTDESWNVFNEARETAKTVLDKTDATQEEVNSALKELSVTHTNLAEKPVAPTDPIKPTDPEKPMGTIKELTLIGGKATLTEKVEEQLKEFKLNRISGKNRYATSVQVSKAYKNSDIVVLASGEKYTDELTATVLASKLDVPILLSGKDVVPEVVIKEIERLGATKVILIGEKGTLSKSVETQLSKYKLERIGGVDRYETAVLIGDQVRTITGNKTQSILVDGTNFPDAIAMTSMGVEQGLPIILAQPNELNKITEKAVKDWGITKVTIGGGTASVSSNIENTLKATVEVERIKGRDRYETSVLVAKQVYKNPTHAVVASGEVFPDAIVGAPYAAKNKYPIILSRGNNVPSIVMDYVTGK